MPVTAQNEPRPVNKTKDNRKGSARTVDINPYFFHFSINKHNLQLEEGRTSLVERTELKVVEPLIIPNQFKPPDLQNLTVLRI